MPAVVSTSLLIQEISFADHWQHILELRDACRQDKDPQLANQLFPAGMYDEFDDTAMHWGIFDEENNLIAAARLSVHRNINELPDRFLFSDIWDKELPAPIASLNRLSVATSYRGLGLSGQLDRIRIQKARRIGCRCICGTTHGKRQLKLQEEGFVCQHSEKLSTVYGTDELTGRKLPLDFYYKLL
jgi:GNAT superfamily N-acetyltransferase